MTTTLKITKTLEATITISEICVLVSTNYMGTKRTTSFNSVNDAIANTTLPAVKNYLQSL